jgi:hypothetical protein
MRAIISWVLGVTAIAGLALPSAGQAVSGRATNVTTGNSSNVARLPYTAEYKITHVRILANGSTITNESTKVEALDTQGRMLNSRTSVPVSENQKATTLVSIYDPVAHTFTNWSVPGEQATVLKMAEPGATRTPCAPTAATTPGSTTGAAAGVVGSVFTSSAAGTSSATGVRRKPPVVEDLGTETIQGVEARGRRTTFTTPVGMIGNNEPLVRTSEAWFGTEPGLRSLIARQITDDPQMGKTTTELTSFTQGEPDASLFQPPSEYEIVIREPSVCGGVPQIALPPPPPAQ